MTRVVMFVYNDVVHDTRVLREAAALRDADHEVTILARPRDTLDRVGDELVIDGIRIVRVAVPYRWRSWWRLVRAPGRALEIAWRRITRRPASPGSGPVRWLVTWRWGTIGWARRAAQAAPMADVYHGHDLSGAVAAERASARHVGRLVYDSHELFMESRGTARQPSWARWFVRRVEAGIVDRANAVVTVNDVIADELAMRYRPRPTAVVHNCPPRWSPSEPGPDRIRAALGLPPSSLVVLCHGGLHPGRGLEETIQAVARLADLPVELVFLGFGPATERYRALADGAGLGSRFHILDAVPPATQSSTSAGADVDVMVIQPTELNAVYSTPNKLFESLAAGVPVVSSDFPSRRRIIVDDPDGPLGVVCDPTDPEAIGQAIRSIVASDAADRADLRRRCLRAAHERWNWETESEKLIQLYRQLGAPTRSDPRRPDSTAPPPRDRVAAG
jgi:glycosyltransferase involved in cell wall biosynthesis